MAISGFAGFVVRSAGARALLRSAGVRSDLERRAQRVRDAAQPHTSRLLIADSAIGRGRALATVIGVSVTEESARRVLGGALDAAR